MHQLRLKNAELRNELGKAKRDLQEVQQSQAGCIEQIRQMERQRKKDCDYLLKQETELEKMRESRQ